MTFRSKLTDLAALAFLSLMISTQVMAATVLKVGLIDPPGHIDVQASERMARRVAEMTGGEIKLEIYPAAQLGRASDMLTGLKLGNVDMFVGATTWLGAFDKDFWISGTLYVFNNQEQARALHESDTFRKMSDRLVKNHSIRIITQNWDRGPRNFISTRPVRTIADLEGLRIRVPPQQSWIENFKLAGAEATPIPLSETFTALQWGIVESTEQASNWLYGNKYHTIAKHLTRTHHNYEETGVMISERVFQSLTDKQRKALIKAATGIAPWHNEEVANQIAEAEKTMIEGGVNIHDVDIAKWKTHFRANFDKIIEIVGYSPELTNELKAQWK
ncbi:MAG: TRAP transporter substrate-binding protein [Candidatus Sedimenticola sp. (ex Thyasira tokunagai)]